MHTTPMHELKPEKKKKGADPETVLLNNFNGVKPTVMLLQLVLMKLIGGLWQVTLVSYTVKMSQGSAGPLMIFFSETGASSQ